LGSSTTKMVKSGDQCLRKCRKKCKACTAFIGRVLIYLFLASVANLRCCWNWLLEPQGPHCRLPPRGAAFNQTRMKVLVYGMAKTGTTSTVALLNKIFDRVYHNEDFCLHIWSPLADEFWTRRENNATVWYPDRLATPAYPAYKGHSFYERRERSQDSTIVWPVLRGESGISEALEACHVDGLSFDGWENLFWSMYERSPEAKVIMLNWRTWDDLQRSRSNWDFQKFWLLLGQNMIQCGFHFLPWSALLVPVWDYFTNTSTDVLRRGLELHSRNFDLGFALFRVTIMERRIVQHWFSGFHLQADTEEEFNMFWETGKRRIPKERLIELDLKKHSPADVCRMLGVSDKPICKDTGRIANVYPLLRPERENVWLFPKTSAVYLVIHYLNHTLLWGATYWLCGLLRSCVLCVAAPIHGSSKGGKLKKKGKTA